MTEDHLFLQFCDRIGDCLNGGSLALNLNLYTNLNSPQIQKKLDPAYLFHQVSLCKLNTMLGKIIFYSSYRYYIILNRLLTPQSIRFASLLLTRFLKKAVTVVTDYTVLLKRDTQNQLPDIKQKLQTRLRSLSSAKRGKFTGFFIAYFLRMCYTSLESLTIVDFVK